MRLNRVGQTHLDFYSGYRKRFTAPQGIAAVKLDFNDKEGPGDDDELTVYGVNSGTGEIFYNKSMVSLGFFGRDGAHSDVFDQAVGICADRHGNVFVADRGRHLLLHLRNDEDNELGVVKTIDLSASGRPLRSPSGVAIEGSRVYVADTGNDRVVEIDLEGNLLREIAGAEVLHGPFGIAVIASREWNFFGSRFVVVTDSLNRRVSMLSMDGQVLGAVRYREISDGKGGFFFAAVDYYSNIYVTDSIAGCIYKFDRHLRYLTRFGCGGGKTAALVEPRGIAIYRRFGQVFVAEKAGASYFWVGTDIQNPRCTGTTDGEGATLRLRFLLTEQSLVSVRVESEKGEVFKRLADDQFMHPGRIVREYRLGTDEIPRPIANCNWRVFIRARPTYSSKKYHSIERTVHVRWR